MVRLVLAGFLASLAVTALPARAPQQGPFQLSCTTLPFETIKKDRDIDDVCDRAGTAGTDPQREQNRAKNQFCASGPAALATEFSFTRLQAAGDAGATGVPADRSILKDLHKTTEGNTIGEGSVVQLIGFLILLSCFPETGALLRSWGAAPGVINRRQGVTGERGFGLEFPSRRC